MRVFILTDLEGPAGVNGRAENVGNTMINRPTAERELVNELNAVCEGLLAAGAEEIERDSWSTTARLVSDSEEDTALPTNEIEIETANVKAERVDVECGLDDTELRFVKAVKELDLEKIKMISADFGMMPDSFAERINEKVSEKFGDVIIDGIYPEMTLIEDYEEDIEKWLLKITK